MLPASEIQPHFIAADHAALLEIAPMTEADLDAVTALEASAQTFPWSRALFADTLRCRHAAWVLRREGAICGFMIMMTVLDEAHLLNLAVQPTRQGLGQRLLRFGLDWAARRGARNMFLDARASNENALALYHRAGFTEIGRRKGYYPAHAGREDGLTLCRNLEDLRV